MVSWDNYATIFESGSFPRNLLNSVVVATLTVASALLLAVTAAYALSRVRFQGRSLLLLTILSVSMFPQMAVLAGLFEVIRFFGLFNSIWGLIFSYMIFTLPFTVWVLTTFMRELPVEIGGRDRRRRICVDHRHPAARWVGSHLSTQDHIRPDRRRGQRVERTVWQSRI